MSNLPVSNRSSARRIVALAAILTACGLPSIPDAPEPANGRPNILLISLDTVRRDALGTYGDGAEASDTPRLDELARESVVFEQAYAPIPFTLSSHMTLFTGLAPDVHGVLGRRHRLAEDVTTLPRHLADAGWSTHGYVTNEWMKADFGFGRGFDHYERVPHGLTYAERVNERALTTLDDAPGDRPWFLFLHYLDAHSDFQRTGHNLPYHTPDADRSDLGIAADDPRFCDDQGECATAFLLAADDHGRSIEPDLLSSTKALYARGVRYLDRHIGALFDALRQRGLYDDTLIIVLADHGEEFREHGRFIHSQAFEECVSVPLMVKLPGGRSAGRRIAGPVSHQDLLPTLLEWLGLPDDGASQGSSLVHVLEGATHEGHEILVRDKNRRRYGLRRGRFKVLRDYEADTVALYDLEVDPGETRDLAALRPGIRDGLLNQLEDRLRRDRERANQIGTGSASEDEMLTPEERERLKAIGYVD